MQLHQMCQLYHILHTAIVVIIKGSCKNVLQDLYYQHVTVQYIMFSTYYANKTSISRPYGSYQVPATE